MKSFYNNRPDGYQEAIRKGLSSVHAFRSGVSYGDGGRQKQIARLRFEMENADAIVIGAGHLLQTARGCHKGGVHSEKTALYPPL